MSRGFKVACAGLLVLCACYYYLAPGARRGAAPRPAVDPITAKKLEIFAAVRQRSADPELAVLYADINQRHFGGELPAIPVMWDDSLKEVDALVGDNHHLQGMTNGAVMLVSPALRNDDDELRRTRRARAMQESSDFNAALERHTAEGAELNRDIDRYRLMVAYPHGIDEQAMAPR